MTAYLEIRSQHSKRGANGKFGGPDTYVAVQVVPTNVEPLKILRADLAEKRGITIRWFGEGYSKYRGPKSALGRAIADATAFMDDVTRKGVAA